MTDKQLENLKESYFNKGWRQGLVAGALILIIPMIVHYFIHS